MGSVFEGFAALAALGAVFLTIGIAAIVRRAERRAIVARLHAYLVSGEVADARRRLGWLVYGAPARRGRQIGGSSAPSASHVDLVHQYFVLLWALDHIGAVALEVQGGRHLVARLTVGGKGVPGGWRARKYRKPWTEAWTVIGQHMTEIQHLTEVFHLAIDERGDRVSDTDFRLNAASAIAIANPHVKNEVRFSELGDVPEDHFATKIDSQTLASLVQQAKRNLDA